MPGTGPGGEDRGSVIWGLVKIIFILLLAYIFAFGSGGCSSEQANPKNSGSPTTKESSPAPKAPNVVGLPDVKNGQKIFQTSCAGCHGVRGKGDGELAAGFDKNKKPKDLTLPEIKGLADSVLSQKIRNGSPSNGMPSWGHLSDKETADLVAYIKTLK